MRATVLIRQLKAAVKQHGDLPVRFFEGVQDNDVGKVVAYDDDGNTPGEFNLPVEIYLHGKINK